MNTHIAALLAATLLATPATAQGAFNMGGLTATVSQDANTQAEERRAGKGRHTGARKANSRMKSLCAERFRYSAAERASEDGREVERMCRAEGF